MDNINRLKSIISGFLLSLANTVNSIKIKQFLLNSFSKIKYFAKKIIKIKIVQGILFAIPFFIAFTLFDSYVGDELGIINYGIFYVGVCFITWSLPDNKFLNFIKIIVSIPYLAMFLVSPFLEVLFVLIFTIFTPIALIGILVKLPELILNLDLPHETELYLLLTISSIYVSLFAEKMILIFIPFWNRTKGEDRVSKRIELVLSLINKGIIKYSIYLLFFISLFIFSIAKFNQIEIFENQDIANVILTSFATFIAFDRLTLNKDLIRLNPKGVMNKIVGFWESELKK